MARVQLDPIRPVDWTHEYPPAFAKVPEHVAIVMDGNGRWANRRGLPRIEGHRAGEAALLDVVAGGLQAGREAHLRVRVLDRELVAVARRGPLHPRLQPGRAAPPARAAERVGRPHPLGRAARRGSGAR